MKRKLFLLSYFALVLIFCIMITGCDNVTNPNYNSNNGNEGYDNILDYPTNVSATRVSSSSVYVSWDYVSEAISYDIYRSYGDNNYEYDGTSTTTSFTSTGWRTSESGYLRVKAVNDSGESSFSAPASFSIYNSPVSGRTRYYGSWKNNINVILTISENGFRITFPSIDPPPYTFIGGYQYIDSPSWTEITDYSASSDYQTGYRISGVITETSYPEYLGESRSFDLYIDRFGYYNIRESNGSIWRKQ